MDETFGGMSSFGTDGWMSGFATDEFLRNWDDKRDDCLKAGMNSLREWMIRFANRMIPSGLDGFAGWNRMNPLGLG